MRGVSLVEGVITKGSLEKVSLFSGAVPAVSMTS